MKAPTVDVMIAKLQRDYDWLMTRYNTPGDCAYKWKVAAKMLRDDLRAILHLRKGL